MLSPPCWAAATGGRRAGKGTDNGNRITGNVIIVSVVADCDCLFDRSPAGCKIGDLSKAAVHCVLNDAVFNLVAAPQKTDTPKDSKAPMKSRLCR